MNIMFAMKREIRMCFLCLYLYFHTRVQVNNVFGAFLSALPTGGLNSFLSSDGRPIFGIYQNASIN